VEKVIALIIRHFANFYLSLNATLFSKSTCINDFFIKILLFKVPFKTYIMFLSYDIIVGILSKKINCRNKYVKISQFFDKFTTKTIVLI